MATTVDPAMVAFACVVAKSIDGGRIRLERITSMKKTLLMLLAVVIAGGSIYLSVRHYRNYQNYKNHTEVIASQQAQEKITQDRKAEDVRQAALITAFDKVYAECEKGVTAYNQLTAAQKVKLVAPSCGAELVQ